MGVGASPPMSFPEEFKARVDLMKAFSETAKDYIQISTAALALPILFTQTMFGKNAAEKGLWAVGVPCSLTMAWVFFLLAIFFGLIYRWLAIRRVWDELHQVQRTPLNAASPGFRKTAWVLQLGTFNLSLIYGAMIVFFILGASLFVVFAASVLRQY
jgi:hypothetical protein